MKNQEPRWLDDDERAAWLALTRMMIRLPAALDAQLQRDSALNHFEYLVMTVLSVTADHTRRMSDLADLCASSLSRLSHVVARLESRSLLRRCKDPSDGRAALVTLAPQGFAVLSEAAVGHVEAVRELVIDRLDAEQLHSLRTIAQTVLDRLDGPASASSGGAPPSGTLSR